MNAINPATGERVETYEIETADDVDNALKAANEAYEEWRIRPLRERERLLTEVAEELRENDRTYAEQITREMGKPISGALAEIEKCAWVCEHYAEHASAYLTPEGHPSPPGVDARTVYEPFGPLLAVMPWNYPFWQVFRFAVPALTAGNVVLLKHASSVPGCAMAIEDAFRQAGLPEGTFRTLLIDADLVDGILGDDRVRGVTLTGSGPAGRAVAATAGEQLKPSVLELGGSDPFVVLEDADVEAAAEVGTQARMQNAGQSCIAAKRFVVHTDVHDEFVNRFVAEVESLTVGDPMDAETDVGPLASEAFLTELHEQVERSLEAGAHAVTGGEPLDREGAYYPPTILTDVPEGCPVDAEETFGPVAAVYEVADEYEAIEKANDTRFGLGASIWTADRKRGRRLAHDLEAGCVSVNQLVKSDPRVPFGGIKESGYGRELAADGITEFVNRKTVWVE
ncbi:NAD-dependent succinate-semialdehyde dehydrogenase [Natronobacterium texcoconense]|uniref:Succinate-semialdehyde dehydrogenase / glutarate-semialdehyde dehydrogenase n=1 Tax=Natronobacterium texcoconense TaxID=1095778 RepID=A0A1H1HK48_NATTX|nr:NAD-dependent succinate-semialdehyde dehydrogenase [Natronobacterium texcoconense]SDR25794.1 succinate-semialdehyde dehydrogenase / glutarate-semialdehyde dehydrogenase [Natronobacterium texcoconense]